MAAYIIYAPTVDKEKKDATRNALKSLPIDVLEMTMRQFNPLLQTDADREELKKLTRRAYNKRQTVKQRSKEYTRRPEVKERRKAYDARPENRERKKANNRRKTALIKAFRDLNPEMYAKVFATCVDEENSGDDEGEPASV
jgi:hypothetical protein